MNLKKKNYSKIVIFTLIFVTLFCVNIFHKEIVNKPNNETYVYQISSIQINDYKERTINNILENTFNSLSKKKVLFKKELIYNETNSTLVKNSTSFNFQLTTNYYFDKKNLEKKLNEEYSEIIDENINDLDEQINMLLKNSEVFNLTKFKIEDLSRCGLIFPSKICNNKDIINYLEGIKFSHHIEKENIFKVQHKSSIINNYNHFKDLPLVFGLSLLILYLLLTPFRKFFKINKK